MLKGHSLPGLTGRKGEVEFLQSFSPVTKNN